MAIKQSQADKDWKNSPDVSTPILDTDLEAISRANRDTRWFVPNGVTSIDEFDDDTLDPAWVRVDGTGAAAANAGWTERGDLLSLYLNGGDNASVVHGLVRPLSSFGGAVAPGDAFVTAVRHWGQATNYTVSGLVLSDGVTHGSGSQVVSEINTGSNFTMFVASLGGSGWTLTNPPSFANLQPTTPLFLRLVCVTASTWRTDASPDGVSWIACDSPQTKAFTPTHVGFLGSSWGAATKSVVSWEFLRRVSGVS